MKIRIGIFLTIIIVILTSCNKKNAEQKQLQKLQKTFTYKSYSKLSKTSLPLLIKSYNISQSGDSSDISIEDARLLIGYSWAISGKYTFAIAEADILKDKSKDKASQMLASSLLAIVYFEKGWNKLAQEESTHVNLLINKDPDDKLQIKLLVYHLLLGNYCMYQKEYSAAKFHFAGLAMLTGIKWPYTLVEAIDDIEKGNVQQGLIKIKNLSKDDTVPLEVRNALAEAIAIVEKNTGDVNSKLFWTKIITKTIFEEMKKALQSTYQKGFDKIDKFTSQIPTDWF